MILIYSPKISNRLRYILQFVLEEVCALEYNLTSDIQLFESSSDPKINYSQERIDPKEFYIYAEGLLSNEGVQPINVPFAKGNNRNMLFPTSGDDFGFDVFSSIFYLISRYEEYLPFEKDKYGRFEASQSYAYRHGFLNTPVVDEWILEFENALKQKFPSLNISNRSFKCVPTIDIDLLFAIKGKSFFRFMRPVLISILKFNFKKLLFLFKVRFGFLKDPFDQLQHFENLHKKYGLKAIYFILFSKKYNRFDINISVKNKDFRKRLRELSKTADVGIHPSYHSRYNYRLVEEEISLLSNALNKTIVSSRQHFLKMRMPNTYKSLLSLGIGNEYTMGYASMPGFRAGTSLSFRFYDIKHEQTTFLRVHPFCVMDATFKTYLNYSEEQAYECIKELVMKLKKVNGTFTPLWHNESISGYGVWDGWSGLYEKMLLLTKNES